jgi:DNA-directed RNA polymerase specialized sigma24 family protein
MLADDAAAKDVTQEVFLRAIAVDARDAFDASPMGWLYRVTTNLCLNKLRDAKRRIEISSGCTLDETQDRDADTQILVRRILDRVPEELQDVYSQAMPFVSSSPRSRRFCHRSRTRRGRGGHAVRAHLRVADPS